MFLGCSEDIVEGPIQRTEAESFASVDDYLKSVDSPSSTFPFNALKGGEFKTAEGTLITIPPSAFNFNGTMVGDMELTLKFKEVYKKSHMIYSGVFPVSNGIPLRSAGAFYLDVRKNNISASLNPNSFIEVEMPAAEKGNDMLLFYGGNNENDTAVNWVPRDTTMDSSRTFFSDSSRSNYIIRTDSLQWINIDAFDSSVKFVNANILLNGRIKLEARDTRFYAFFKGRNTVYPLPYIKTQFLNNLIQEVRMPSLPMTLLCIAVKDKQLLYGATEITPSDNDIIEVDVIETTSKELNATIDKFP